MLSSSEMGNRAEQTFLKQADAPVHELAKRFSGNGHVGVVTLNCPLLSSPSTARCGEPLENKAVLAFDP